MATLIYGLDGRHWETFTFKDKDDFEDKILGAILKRQTPWKASLQYFFLTQQVGTVIFIEGAKLLPSPDRKMKKLLTLILITCFCYYDIYANTSVQRRQLSHLSCQNDAGSHTSTTQYLENLVFEIILIGQNPL